MRESEGGRVSDGTVESDDRGAQGSDVSNESKKRGSAITKGRVHDEEAQAAT